MWIPLAMMAGSAIMGANKANREMEMQKAQNLAAAEQTRYSPWTGQSGQLNFSRSTSGLEGAVGGGLQGLAMGQSLQGAFDGPMKDAPVEAPAAQPSYLGGNAMAQQLGSGMQSPMAQPGGGMMGGSAYASQLGSPWMMNKPNVYASR